MSGPSHGSLIVNWFLWRLSGSPFLVNRLVMLLSNALDELPFEKAARIAAHWVCDHECVGEEGLDEDCYEECMERSLAELKKLAGTGSMSR